MGEFADRWLTRDGLSLYARDYAAATGPARLPVICLHGLTRNSADFEEVAPWIAGLGRRVLVPDVRGRGRSDRDPQARYQPNVYGADVLALMDGLGIARALFVGTSMGGLITMTMVALRQQAVAGVVLNDVGPELAAAGIRRIMGYVGKAGPVTSWDEAAAYAQSVNGSALPHYGKAEWMAFARRTFVEDPDGKPVLAYDPAIAAALGKAKPVPKWLLWRLFARLAKRPTLLIRGGESDLIDATIAAKMRAKAPQMSYAEVPGVGHAPMLNEPAAKAALETWFSARP